MATEGNYQILVVAMRRCYGVGKSEDWKEGRKSAYKGKGKIWNDHVMV